ncbi:3-oxoacyl-ACP synthase III family protein [Anaerovibrio sp.]|uniref:3-oxoacyl-ACP synthase III family protein n=1 Tax=Anaerovibrio sp. TaxID=1872532 RepID=UPI003F13E8EA
MKAYIKKIAYYLPENMEENPQGRLRKKTGIDRRHICGEGEIASQLAGKAAENVFALGVKRSEVEMLLLCTQSPDYFLPTTACILQDRLGLPKNCGALDFNLGCSGYIYGLSLAKGLIESGQVNNVLLLTAETYSKYINEHDNSVKPLFGDGASATFIEAVDTDEPGLDGFVTGTDGGGYAALIVPAGGMARPYNTASGIERADEYGNLRTDFDLHMKGNAISEFALEVVPDTLQRILAKTGKAKEDIGYFVFHQANKFMLEYLQQKCGLMDCPYWNDVAEYGNTVSSSIPIAICDMLRREKPANPLILSIGFGVGLSWGGCLINLRYASTF